MRLQSVKKWWRERLLMREIKRWLRAGGEPLVGTAMYHLNHAARAGTTSRSTAYALKNALVRYWYQQGHCLRVNRHLQTFECWNCGGTGHDGWEDDDVCWKCGGTGIYRQYLLYQFVFRVHDRTFIWHQPADLVDWPVTTESDEPREYIGGRTADTPGPKTLTAYKGLVYLYLSNRGVKNLPGLMTLRQAILEDVRWTDWYWPVRCWLLAWDRRWHNAKRFFRFIETGDFSPPPIDDDLPF